MKKLQTIFFFLFVLVYSSFAQEIPPKPQHLVTDIAGALNPGETSALEQKLVAFNDSTSTQIAILIISTLDGYPIEDYGQKVAEAWGIGRKDKNNGALVLVVLNDHKLRIEVGYGLEAVIPDITAKNIITKVLKPNFKAGQYYRGLDEATTLMMQLASGEYTADSYNGEEKDGKGWIIFPILAGIFLIVFLSKFNRTKGYARRNNIPFWVAWGLLNAASNRSSGSWGGFSSGSGFGGGSSGSSFGGFGGGSFGGGGASGDW